MSAEASSQRPWLLFFYSKTSGHSRRVDAYLAQVLQQHRNHETFQLIRVAVEEQHEFGERLKIRELPTLLVIEGRKVRARLEAPHNRPSIQAALAPWLR